LRKLWLTIRLFAGRRRVLLIAVVLSAILALSLLYFETNLLPFKYPLVLGRDPSMLSLSISQNATSITQQQDLLLTITARNTLFQAVRLEIVNDWPDSNMSSGPCGLMFPLGIAVYNASGSHLDTLNENGFPFCPLIVFRNTVDLGPFESITQTATLRGYWTPGITPVDGGFQSGILHPFPPGSYTVFAGDIWGNLAITHFTVVATQ